VTTDMLGIKMYILAITREKEGKKKKNLFTITMT